MLRSRSSTVVAALLVLLSGCLPYSCRREAPTALLPADSSSRAFAETVAVDTMTLSWSRTGGDALALRHPRTVRFGPVGTDTLYIGDAALGAVLQFDTAGALHSVFETVDVPYLAGIRADTVSVFDPSGPTLLLLVGGRTVQRIPISDPDRPRTALVYGAFDGEVFYKRVDADAESFIAAVNRDGSLRARYPLPGPQWRHAGLLRPWGDTLLSLAGFRPVVDVLDVSAPNAGDEPSAAGRLDSLVLHGFDSPMLARTRSFMMGDVDEPPLLTSSAAPAGDRLFVLNMRAGWLQVDVFDRNGRLIHRITEAAQAYREEFFPQDLDVRRRPDGAYDIAVVLTQPEPSVRLYTWRPGPDS